MDLVREAVYDKRFGRRNSFCFFLLIKNTVKSKYFRIKTHTFELTLLLEWPLYFNISGEELF